MHYIFICNKLIYQSFSSSSSSSFDRNYPTNESSGAHHLIGLVWILLHDSYSLYHIFHQRRFFFYWNLHFLVEFFMDILIKEVAFVDGENWKITCHITCVEFHRRKFYSYHERKCVIYYSSQETFTPFKRESLSL